MSRRITPSLAILVCLLIWAIASQIVAAISWGHESFQLSEWLINYAGGFVRRGLPGALIAMLANASGVQANHIVIITGFGCFLVLALWFLRRATPVFPAVLIVSCIVMGFPAYQDSIVRKDCLGLLMLLGCLSAAASRWSISLRIWVVNFVAAMAILSHEAFCFYAVPALVLFRSWDEEPPLIRELTRRCFVMFPAVVCFCLVTWFHGTPAIAEAVNQSWLPLWRDIEPGKPGMEVSAAAIQALGWSSQQGVAMGSYVLSSGFYQPVAWVCMFVVSCVLVVLFTGRGAQRGEAVAMESTVQVTAILLAQLLFISPLFLLGCDYGRWLFFWVASSLMLHTTGRRAPCWLESGVACVFANARVVHLLARLPVCDWYLLFFGVPVLWSSHNFLAASPISRHLLMVWSWF